MVWGSEAEACRDQLAASTPWLGQQVLLAVTSLAPSAWGEPVQGKDPLAGMVKPLALTPAG